MGAIMGTVGRLSQRRKNLRVRRKSEVEPSVCRARWLWAQGRLSQALRSCVQSLLVWCLMDSTVTGRRRWRRCALDKAAVKSANAPTNRDHLARPNQKRRGREAITSCLPGRRLRPQLRRSKGG